MECFDYVLHFNTLNSYLAYRSNRQEENELNVQTEAFKIIRRELPQFTTPNSLMPNKVTKILIDLSNSNFDSFNELGNTDRSLCVSMLYLAKIYRKINEAENEYVLENLAKKLITAGDYNKAVDIASHFSGPMKYKIYSAAIKAAAIAGETGIARELLYFIHYTERRSNVKGDVYTEATRILGKVVSDLIERDLFKEAFEIVDFFPCSETRNSNYLKIVKALNRISFKKMAVYMEKFIQVCKIINDPFVNEALKENALLLINKGRVKMAIDAAVAISSSHHRNECLVKIAEALAQRHDWDRAIEIIESIDDFNMKNQVRKQVAVALAKIGYWDRAIEIIESIDDFNMKNQVREQVAVALAKIGYWDQAIEIIESIDPCDIQIEALKKIANLITEDNANEILAEFPPINTDDINLTLREIISTRVLTLPGKQEARGS